MEKKTIVVIDDMPAILEHAKQILRDEYKVVPCTAGSKAVEICEKLHPDLVLVDVNMPELDGYQFLDMVKSMDSLKDIPVIMTTAEVTTEIEAKGFEKGAEDFITKPFFAPLMLKRINNLLTLKSF